MIKFPRTYGLVLATMGLSGLAANYAINEKKHKKQMESDAAKFAKQMESDAAKFANLKSDAAKFAHEEKLMILSQHLNSLNKKEVEDLSYTLKKIAKDVNDIKEAIAIIMKEWKVGSDN